MMPLYPVHLAINGQLCLVVGGGKVATRKVQSLLPCGAVIRVISPVAEQRIVDLAEMGQVEWLRRNYQQGDLQGAKLVFAATDNEEVQDMIVAEARASDILVNVITRPDACTFQVPASLRSGDLLITVATGGGSPALAARIRKELQQVYGPEYGRLVALMGELRRQVIASGGSPEEHKRIFEKVLEDDILDRIRKKEWQGLENRLENILPPAINISALRECAEKG